MMYEFSGYHIQITRRSNARRLHMTHRQNEAFFRLSAPAKCPRAEIDRFLLSNLDWMARMMAKVPQLTWQPAFASGERHWVLGELVTLGENGVPCGEAAFTAYRLQQLKGFGLACVLHWQQVMGVRINVVAWRAMVSRWGSCRPKSGAITLNLNMAPMPRAFVEQVVVHELNHMRHQDHQQGFYADMERYLPDWKAREQLGRSFNGLPLPPL